MGECEGASAGFCCLSQKYQIEVYIECGIVLTEHFAWRSKVNAEGMGLRGVLVDIDAIGTRG